MLYRHFVSAEGTQDHLQLVVPKSLQEGILRQIHDNGKNWCNTCVTCATHKTSPPKPKAALQTVQAGYPLQIVAVDIVGPFPESEAGNSYILVVGDYFTRWMEAITVARMLTDKFFCRFGLPEQLHSDQGK